MVPAGDDAQAVVGTTIAGKYFVHALLGRGGMGHVYKATLLGPDLPVALKLVTPGGLRADPALARRFEREAAAASRLRHPNAVEVLDFGAGEGGVLYLAMELVPGRTLAQVIAEEAPLPPATVAHLGGQVLAALAEAHAQGVVHRDLKPANVMVDPLRDPAGFVKVVDFGIATVAGAAAGETRITAHDVVLGTPAYMSPEQIRGEPLDARSDLYSVGVMLFEMLAGALPFEAPTAMALAARHLSDRAPRLSGRRPALAAVPALEELVARALEKEPARRPESAEAMRAALAEAVRAAGGARLTPARPIPPTVPLRAVAAGPAEVGGARRRRVWMVAGVAAVGVAGVLLAGRAITSAPPTATATRTVTGTGTAAATATATATAEATVTGAATATGTAAAPSTPSSVPTPPSPRAATRPALTARRPAADPIRLVRGELGSIPTPPAASGDGVLVLVATPWAQVKLGDVDLGETPREVRVAAGSYGVRAVHPELGVRDERVAVKAGERRLWAARFEQP